MKSLVILALAAGTLAAPSGGEKQARGVCSPATYACATNPTSSVPGWQVCDVTGTWVVSTTVPGLLPPPLSNI
jgi:hypothetical protein